MTGDFFKIYIGVEDLGVLGIFGFPVVVALGVNGANSLGIPGKVTL